MKMWDKLIAYFNGRQFREVDLHKSGMKLYYLPDEPSVALVWMLTDEGIQGLTREQIDDYAQKIRQSFLQQQFEFVQLQLLFLTDNVTRAKELGAHQMFWVVDEVYGRLVIFENQPEEYLGLRGMIETNLSFGGESRNSEGYQKTARTADPNSCEQKSTGMVSEPTSKEQKKAMAQLRRDRWVSHRKYDMRKLNRVSYITYGLIAINLLIFLIGDIFLDTDLWSWGGISWESVVENGQWYRILTNLFLHGSIDHVVGNMIGLFAAGEIVERSLGHARFTILYFVSGLGSTATSIIYHHLAGIDSISIGASGAIYGVFGAVVMVFLLDPNVRSRANLVRAAVFVAYLFYGMFINPNQGVDYAGHAGGFIVGGAVYPLLIFFGNALLRRKQRRRWKE